MALTGHDPFTAMEKLANESLTLRAKSSHGQEWQLEAEDRLKQRFSDELFPALLRGDIAPFQELIDAMEGVEKYGFGGVKWQTPSIAHLLKVLAGSNCEKLTKEEKGRVLRWAVLTIGPNQPQKMVQDFLDKYYIPYADESHIAKVIRELQK